MYNTAGSHLVLSHCTFCSVVPSSSTHPLPFPFLGSCLTAVSRIFPKVSVGIPPFLLPLFLPSSFLIPLSLLPQCYCLALSSSRASTYLHLHLFWPSLISFRWYHGHLSGVAAESLLQAKATPWTFLVRESLSKPGDFVLSVLTDQPKPGSDAPPAGATSASGARLKVTHIKIMCEVSRWESKRRRE